MTQSGNCDSWAGHEQIPWPAPPDGLSAEPGAVSAQDQAMLAFYQAQLTAYTSDRNAAARARETELDLARQASRAMLEAEDRRREDFLAAYLEVGRTAMKRCETGREFRLGRRGGGHRLWHRAWYRVLTADGQPLPLTGIIPMVLIGASLVSVGIYVGFVRGGVGYGRALAAGTGAKADQNRLNTYLELGKLDGARPSVGPPTLDHSARARPCCDPAPLHTARMRPRLASV